MRLDLQAGEIILSQLLPAVRQLMRLVVQAAASVRQADELVLALVFDQCTGQQAGPASRKRGGPWRVES